MTSVVSSIEACIPALRRYASVLVRDRQDVDDLVHDCLVRALDQLHTRREEGDLRAWMFAIMHNLFISRARRLKMSGHSEPFDTIADDGPGVQAGQDSHMERRDVMRALKSLPEDQRTVLVLVAVEGLPYAEVARVIGVPVGTIMSRLSRARERLRRSMQGEDVGRPALRRVK